MNLLASDLRDLILQVLLQPFPAAICFKLVIQGVSGIFSGLLCALRVLAQELRIVLDAQPTNPTNKTSKIETDDDALRITLMDGPKLPMFKPATAQLNDFAYQRLKLVGEKLAKSGARLTIEGHTDGVGGDSAANWALSGQRALAARQALLDGGLTPDRIAGAVAMGGSQPLYPDQPNRAENRRITIIVKGEAPSLPTDASFRF